MATSLRRLILKSRASQYSRFNFRYFCTNNNKNNNGIFEQLKDGWKTYDLSNILYIFQICIKLESLIRARDEIQNQVNNNKNNENNNNKNNNNNDDDENNTNNYDFEEWINKYNDMRLENKFEIAKLHEMDYKNQWEYYSIIWIKDPLYRYAMNSMLTGFSQRFISYHELMVGFYDGFKFIIECLNDNDYNSLKNCFIEQIYHHIKKLKISILDIDGNDELKNVNGYIYNIRVDREQIDLNKIKEGDRHSFNTPIELFFDVKYYCKFYNKNDNQYKYKIIDILWHSKWKPIINDRLKYQIDSPWTIQHFTVSVITYTDHS